MPSVYSIWIVGRNGGLLYNRDLGETVPIEFNDKLRMASSWFGMCGISAQLSPQHNCNGIEVLHGDRFDLHSFQTLTGTTFMLVTVPAYPQAASILRDRVYQIYCDYVLKNPFYEPDQVIKSELFDRHIALCLQERASA